MTQQPEPVYFPISEEEIDILCCTSIDAALSNLGTEMHNSALDKRMVAKGKIFSRGTIKQQSVDAPCPQHKIWQHCPASAAIRADERERMLDKLKVAFKVSQTTGRETDYELGFRQGMTHAICEIESLRGEVRKP